MFYWEIDHWYQLPYQSSIYKDVDIECQNINLGEETGI